MTDQPIMIRIVPIIPSGIEWAKWLIFVALADGLEDPTRSSKVAGTTSDALAIAEKMAEALGIPVAPESLKRVQQ